MDPWQIAALCGIAFVLSHHLMSHLPVRTRLVETLGEGPYLALYSIVSLVFYVPLAGLWWRNSATTPVWWANHGTLPTLVASVLITAGFVLVVGGAVMPGRTSLSAKMMSKRITRVAGMARFTRHAVFMGIALFSLGHLVVDGGAVDVAFHGTNLAVGLIGGPHQDQRALASDPTYAEWMQKTRLVPLPWPRPGASFGPLFWGSATVGLVLAGLARVLLHY